MDYKKIDFTTYLGKTDKNGHWLDVEESKKNEDEPSQSTAINDDNMYVFEGIDYRGAAQKADVDLFDRLILDEENKSTKIASSSHQRTSERPQRRQMTEEEKTARAEKMRETKARRKQEMVRDIINIFVVFNQSFSAIRRKKNENVKNDVKQDYSNYGPPRTTVLRV
jgi:hypothetical protein